MPPDPNNPQYYMPPPPEDPFGGFDTRISYQRMIEQQQIAQFQQYSGQAQALSPYQQSMVARMPRFQYGVPGGQPNRVSYNRLNQLSKNTYASYAAMTTAEIAAWPIMSGVGAAVGGAVGMLGGPGGAALGAKIGTYALPIAASMIATGSLENSLARQKQMASIAIDIESNRSKLGLTANTRDVTNLAGSMHRSMYRGGEYFSPEKQMEIHKVAISEGLLNARNQISDQAIADSGGKITQEMKSLATRSGSIQQYKQNFEDLKKTTKDIVELLQTTVEGGLSVMKELKTKGFTTMKDIRSQIVQAKAYGGLTGMGAQNMMLVGASGAEAVQGTGLSARAGVEAYQFGAATAGAMAGSNIAFRQSVQRAGGVAQSGAVIGGSVMNILQSRMGAVGIASIMNNDMSVNNDALQMVMSGNMTSEEMVRRKNRLADGMTPSDKVLFGRNQRSVIDRMLKKDPAMGNMFVQGLFKAWGSGREGTAEAKAQVYAGTVPGLNQAQQDMFADYLTSNKDFYKTHASKKMEEFNMTRPEVVQEKSMLSQWWGRNLNFMGKAVNTDWIAAQSSSMYNAGLDKPIGIVRRASRGLGRAFMYPFMTPDQRKFGFRKQEWASLGDAMTSTYYDNRPRTAAEQEAFDNVTMEDINAIERTEYLDDKTSKALGVAFNTKDNLSNRRLARLKKSGDIRSIRRKIRTVQALGTADMSRQFFEDKEVLGAFGFDTDADIELDGKTFKAKNLFQTHSSRMRLINTISANTDEGIKNSNKQIFEKDAAYQMFLNNFENENQKRGSRKLVNEAIRDLKKTELVGQTTSAITKNIEGIISGTTKVEGLQASTIELLRKAKPAEIGSIVSGTSGYQKLEALPDLFAGGVAEAIGTRQELQNKARKTLFGGKQEMSKWEYFKDSFTPWKPSQSGKQWAGNQAIRKGLKESGSELEFAKMIKMRKQVEDGEINRQEFDAKYGGTWDSIKGDNNLSALVNDSTVSFADEYMQADHRAKYAEVRQRDLGKTDAYASIINERLDPKFKIGGDQKKALGYLMSGGKHFKKKFEELAGEDSKGMLRHIRSSLIAAGATALEKSGLNFDSISKQLKTGDFSESILSEKEKIRAQIKNTQKKLAALNVASVDEDGKWTTMYKGEELSGKGTDKLEIAKEAARDKERALMYDLQEEKYKERERGRGMQTEVAAPILNYWNNRWTL